MTLDKATPVKGATKPIRMTIDVSMTQIPGHRTHGSAIIGFKIIGKPNITGSVILKIEVAMESCPRLLYCFALENNNRIVNPKMPTLVIGVSIAHSR